MGGSCRTHGRDEICIQYLGLKIRREEITWKTWAEIGGNIRIDRTKIGWETVDWIHLAQW